MARWTFVEDWAGAASPQSAQPICGQPLRLLVRAKLDDWLRLRGDGYPIEAQLWTVANAAREAIEMRGELARTVGGLEYRLKGRGGALFVGFRQLGPGGVPPRFTVMTATIVLPADATLHATLRYDVRAGIRQLISLPRRLLGR